MDIVMMNTKKKMNIHDAIAWYDSNVITVIRATRLSERGTKEKIYLIGAGQGYKLNVNDSVMYITDTGVGYGGKGNLIIEDIIISGKSYCNKIMTTRNIMELNEEIKLTVWVMK